MNSKAANTKWWRRVNPYWFWIVLVWLCLTILYIYHLTTGYTPDRAFIRIEMIDFEVFWYAVVIVSGIALGAYVIAQLAQEKAQEVFARTVPKVVRERPLSALTLPEEILKILTKQKISTVGQLLLQWGYNPRYLGVNQDGLQLINDQLSEQDGVDVEWLNDAPWRQWNPEHVWSGIGWVMVMGLIGARLYHVLTPSPSMAALGIETPLDYFRNPNQIINLRNGGLGIYGGIVGGLVGLFIYTRRQRLSMLYWTDYCAIAISLGQAIGRWGNFFNQELYGRPTDVFWAVQIDPIHRLPAFSDFSHFHPAFLYESLWSLLTFFVLLYLYRHQQNKLLTGDLTALYLIFYGVGRSLLELIRLDSRSVMIGNLEVGIAIATLVSLATAVLMIIWLVLKHYRKRPL